MTAGERFRDAGGYLSTWADDVLVVCPRCGARASVSATAGDERRLACGTCGLTKAAVPDVSYWGGAVDPWFRCPLWLQAPFGEHTVWAFNARHAAELRGFVGARHRERTPAFPAGAPASGMSMVERLPGWMKDAKNRRRLTKLLDDLIERAGP